MGIFNCRDFRVFPSILTLSIVHLLRIPQLKAKSSLYVPSGRWAIPYFEKICHLLDRALCILVQPGTSAAIAAHPLPYSFCPCTRTSTRLVDTGTEGLRSDEPFFRWDHSQTRTWENANPIQVTNEWSRVIHLDKRTRKKEPLKVEKQKIKEAIMHSP
jgi:hypothetical protein